MNTINTIKPDIFTIRLPYGIDRNGAKLAGLIIWSCLVTGIASFFVSQFMTGTGPFWVSYYVNRFWALLVILPFSLLALDYLLLFHGFSYPLFFVLLLGISAVYGVLCGNKFSYILADFTLLFSPILFYILSQKYLKKSNIKTLIKWLFHINLVLGLLAIIGIPIGYEPILLLSGILLCFVFPALSKYFFEKSLSKYILAIIVSAFCLFGRGSNKTQLLQVTIIMAYLLIIRFYRKRVSLKFIRNFTIITALIVVSGIFGMHYKYRSYRLLEHFFQTFSVEKTISNWDNPDNLFNILGQSTGHRIFELIKVEQTIRYNIMTTFFGFGLGGSVDMSGSKDETVLSTYGESISNVRVFHLMPVYMLAKFGLMGIITMLIGIIWFAKYLFWNFKHFDLIKLFAVSYLLAVAFGAFITFSFWIKYPLVGIMIWILSKKKY